MKLISKTIFLIQLFCDPLMNRKYEIYTIRFCIMLFRIYLFIEKYINLIFFGIIV